MSRDLSKGPPLIPLDLVEHLEAIYPNAFPAKILGSDPHAIAADLHRHAGRLEVVQYLRDHLSKQARSASPTQASA